MSNTVDILIQVRAQLAALQQTVDGMRRVGAAAGEAQRASSGLASIFAAGGAFGLGQMSVQGLASGILSAASASIRYRAELEQQTVAFQSLLGSVEAAQERMQDLESFAASTPFELPEIVRASRVLESLTDGALASGDGLRIVGDAAAAAGRSFDETAMWVGRLYSGLKAGAPVGEATMRLMEMGLVSGDTARKLNEMAEKGQATGRAMEVIRETFGKTAGAMELQSQTLNGLWSTLRGTMKSIGSDAVAPATEEMKKLLGVTLELLGAMDRAETRRQKVNEVSLAALKRAAAPTSEADRQAQIQAADAGIQAARNRLAELRELQDQQASAVSGVPGFILTDLKAAAEAAQVTAEMEALVVQMKAYEAVKKRLSTAESGRKAANAEAETETAKAVAAQQKAQEEAAAWLEKNGRAARELVADYQRSLLPLQERVQQLQSIVEVEEEAMASALSRATSEQEHQRIRLESETRLVAVRRELAAILKETSELNAREAADAQRARRDETRLGLRDASRGLDDRQAELSVAHARLDADFTKTRLEKRAESIRLQRESIALLDEEIGRLQAKRDAESDPAIREDVSRSIDGLKRQRRGAVGELQRFEGGPDPYSVRDQMEATLTEMESRLPTVAEGIAETFRTAIGTAISSISDGIQGLIIGTKSWGSALMEIRNSVFQSILKSIVDMAVQWAVTHVIMRGISTAWAAFTTALGWQQVAQTNAQEAAKAPALATNAAMASAGSYGISAIVGVAALVAAIGVAIAAAAGAFADGGLVSGPGGPRDDKILARLSNGEYVVNAQATAENRPLLDAINSGRAADIAVGGPTVNVGAAPVSIAVLNSREELMRWVESTEGQKAIFDAVRRRRIDLGGTT